MKHAFLILAHSHPDLLGETVRLLMSDNHFFYIHIDRKQDIEPFKNAVKGCGNVCFLDGNNRINVNWGGYSIIQATLNLLNMAIGNKALDYFHLISGQDFPCVSNREFDSFFEHHTPKSFMHFDSPQEIKEWRKEKYPNRVKGYLFTDFYIGKTLTKITRPFVLVLGRLLPRKPIKNLVGGWNWFTWHKSVVSYVLDYIRKNPEYLKRFKYTSCCDEIIFHTLLDPVTERMNIERTNALRFIEWHPKREFLSLPLVLDTREYDEIADSGAFFCRKVDPVVSRKLMDKLKLKILR